ncbi:LysE family translocator [Marinomonas transparens]|uniref:LysE family translocator n=1 Tax=Marinomonas transparens TaxID=2795388 RepID=A0A934JWF9_9GAMM|nr:LysE family translocator [Marinomonas transparens]MBJ7539631.1 LysE family translocator [Marinomonas transparens]
MNWQLWLVTAPFLMLLALSPGPNNFTAIYNGMQVGPVGAVVASLGRNIAFAILMLVSALGLGAVIVSSVFWFGVVKWLGVVYLLYIGIKTWRSAAIGLDEQADSTVVSFVSHYARIRQEFLIAISNPKAILIFTAIFPQLLDLSMPVAPQFLVIGVTFIFCEFLAAYIYAVSGKQIRRFIKSHKGMLRLNKGMGSLFVLASMLLASSSRS